jgi:Tol biopolymer transport system component
MSSPSGPYFFVSYSRADIADLRRIVTELRKRGVNAWVDTENLIPGSPEWEREIERSIRGAAGIIVLLSPHSNDSQWVRRELSFAEEIDKRLFPVHIRGDENDSIPLRLAAHQRVDLRSNFSEGLDRLADALNDHLGTTKVIERSRLKPKRSFSLPSGKDVKKLALPVSLVLLALLCISGMVFAVKAISNIRIPTATSPVAVNTPTQVNEAGTPTQSATAAVDNYPEPTGKIVYTCNIASNGDELCIINADGTEPRRLTDSYRSSNATLSPDGKSIVYVMDNGKNAEVYEMDLASGKSTQLTDLKKNVGSPEISPDNRYIIFHYYSGNNFQICIMDRDGSNPRKFLSQSGKDLHDPTWSPDGTQILFALGKGDNNQLYIMDLQGGEPKLVNDSIDTRGRSDWSVNDFLSFDQGGPFLHDVYLMDTRGNDLHQVSPSGLNAQGASLSPDGNWIAFTGYTDVKNQDQNSCEIFIMRLDGSDVRQLTKNSTCDYQPRWGN